MTANTDERARLTGGVREAGALDERTWARAQRAQSALLRRYYRTGVYSPARTEKECLRLLRDRVGCPSDVQEAVELLMAEVQLAQGKGGVAG